MPLYKSPGKKAIGSAQFTLQDCTVCTNAAENVVRQTIFVFLNVGVSVSPYGLYLNLKELLVMFSREINAKIIDHCQINIPSICGLF